MATDPIHQMHRVLDLAEQALYRGELPIAATIVLNGEVIAAAHTQEKRQKRLLVHAEFLALDAADKLGLTVTQRREAILYTNLEPCTMCLGASLSFMLGSLYYGLASSIDGAVDQYRANTEILNRFVGSQNLAIEGGLCAMESKALFQKYIKMHKPSKMVDWVLALLDKQ